MPGDEGGSVLAAQNLAQPAHVIGQPGHLELGRGDAVPLRLQLLYHGTPAGAVGPGAVDQDDVGQRSHVEFLSRMRQLGSDSPTARTDHTVER